MAVTASPQPAANRENEVAIALSAQRDEHEDRRDVDAYASAELKRRTERNSVMVMRARQHA